MEVEAGWAGGKAAVKEGDKVDVKDMLEEVSGWDRSKGIVEMVVRIVEDTSDGEVGTVVVDMGVEWVQVQLERAAVDTAVAGNKADISGIADRDSTADNPDTGDSRRTAHMVSVLVSLMRPI